MADRLAVAGTLGAALVALGVHGVSAQTLPAEPTEGPPEDPALVDAARRAATESPLGPSLVVEAIEVLGGKTREAVVQRALGIAPGERLEASDARLVEARVRILALGHFADADVRLRRGTRPGAVVITVRVVARGTIVIDRLFLGLGRVTPWWAGADVGDANFLGSGLRLGVAAVVAGEGEAEGARAQWGARLRLDDPSVLGSRVGLGGAAWAMDASEVERTGGDPDVLDADQLRAFDLSRRGGAGRVSVRATRSITIGSTLRLEGLRADTAGILAPEVEDGASLLASGSLSATVDTRPDPVLPWRGIFLDAAIEQGGGDYNFTRLVARASGWIPLDGPRWVLGVHLAGGAIFGDDAPRFERFHLADWNPLLPQRALDLVVEPRPAWNVFGNEINQHPRGDRALAGRIELSRRIPVPARGRLHAGAIYAGVGAFGVGAKDAGLPLDLTFDAGVRLDTALGIFELGIANGVGRLPW